jgi:hypothetical protein
MRMLPVLGKVLGVLLEVDNADKSKPNRKGFLRIRVLINLKNPLATGFLHQRPPKAPAQIVYQYERLSDFCYACGRLGHLSFSCPIVPRPPDNGIYGPHLKASPPKDSRVEVNCLCVAQCLLSLLLVWRSQLSVYLRQLGLVQLALPLNSVSHVWVQGSQVLQTCPISTKPLLHARILFGGKLDACYLVCI